MFAILCFFLSSASFAQVEFEEGYLIDKNGERVTCLLRNVDWRFNPAQVKYKLIGEQEIKTATVADILGFGVGNELRFERFEIQLDTSSDVLSKLSRSRLPLYKTATVFLRVLLEGDASLYQYESNSMVKFFFRAGSEELQPLVYKKYKFDEKAGQVAENDTYKQQLFNLKCGSMELRDAKNLRYTHRDLLSYFKKYNTCANAEVRVYQKQSKKRSFHLAFKAGAKYGSFSMKNIHIFVSHPFESQLTPQAGLEFQWVLPFNKNKWVVLLEPMYNSYKADSENASIDYSSIEGSFGVRHYFFLTDNSRLFTNALLTKDMLINKDVYAGSRRLDPIGAMNFAIGAGYAVKRHSVEFRYQSGRDLLGEFTFWVSSYKAMNLTYSFILF